MKRRKFLSLLLAFLMVLSVFPALTAVKAKAETIPDDLKNIKNSLSSNTITTIELGKDYEYTDTEATLTDAGFYTWIPVRGENVIDLKGHKLNIKVKNLKSVCLFNVEQGASLTILDSSANKTGEIVFDADINDDNSYRLRTVIRNEGTLKIYGGAFTAGHYESYYSAYYVKTIYKMTNGIALDNHNAAYIYGGTFTGRNYDGAAIRVRGYTCVYDAKLIGKGGAKGFDTSSSGASNLRVFAAYIDLYKENAVKNSGSVTKGYDFGTSGITADYLAEGYQIKEQKYTDRADALKNNLRYATLLDIRPGDSKPELTFNTGGKTMNVDAEPGKGLETRFYFSPTYTLPHDLKNPDDSYISNIYFHVTLQKKANGQWVKVTEKNSTRHQTYFTLKDLYSGYENNTDYRILVSASLDYQGYNRKLDCINNSEVIIYVNVSSDKVITEAGAAIAIPTAGSTVNYAITSAAPSDYTAEITGWYTKSGSKLADTDKFTADQEYYAEVKFTALSGRRIADNAVYKINGTTCQTYTNYNTLAAHWPVKIVSTVKEITYVAIEDFTRPIVGMTPGQVFDFNFTFTATTGTYIEDFTWYERTVEGNLEGLGKNDTFEYGKNYCLQMLIGAASGYKFTGSTEFGINGDTDKVNAARTVTSPQQASIYTVDFSAEYLQTKITFDANGGTKETDYPGYKYVKFGQPIGSAALWYLPDNYDYFRTGYFLDGWYTEKDGGVKINNTDLSTFISDVTLYAHWHKSLVNTVEIDGIKTPAAGQTAGSCLDCFTLPVGAHYEITSAKWYKIFLDVSGSDNAIESDYVFKADGNEAYYIEFILAPADGYEFSQSTEILFNGSDSLIDEEYTDIYNETIRVFTVNLLCEEPEYTVKVTDGTANVTKTYSGQTVTLTANAPASGKVFDKWVVVSGGAELDDVTKASAVFTMPAANVEIRATYKDASAGPENPDFIYGDVDGNKKVETADARLALRGSIGLKDAGIELTDKTSANFLAADVDCDGKLTTSDARLILRFSIGLENKLGK